MKFVSFVTDQKSRKNEIIDVIKNLEEDLIHIGPSEKILSSGFAVGFLSNLSVDKVDVVKCFENAVKLSIEQDENIKKFIFIIIDKFNDNINYNIQKSLSLEKRLNILENFCNFYFLTTEKTNFDHPNLNYIKDFEEIIKILNSH